MALQALKIVEDEIARCRRTLEDGTPAPAFSAAGVNDRLDSLEARIRDRIEKECIEQPEPSGLDEAIKELVRCTWCKGEDSEAVAEFWVQEPGEFRDSKEALCEGCANSLPEDGIRVEIVKPGPQEYCRFCGMNRENCHGGGGPDGIEAHDFAARDVISNMDEEDVPF